MQLKNITNNFNEIIVKKTLSAQHIHNTKSVNNEFSSFLEDDTNKQEAEIQEFEEKEESSMYVMSEQVELQNTSYLNKIFLFSVA